MALKSIELLPGECVILPSGAVIDSIIVNGAASVTSTCGDLPTPSQYKCGYFFLAIDCGTDTQESMDESQTYYTSITVGSNTYNIGERVGALTCGTVTQEDVLNVHIPDLAIFQFMEVKNCEVGVADNARQEIFLYFQTPESLFDSVELKVLNRNHHHYYKPLEATCDEYADPPC